MEPSKESIDKANGNGSGRGPLRKVIELRDVEFQGYIVEMELLECGHLIPCRKDFVGLTNSQRRRCAKCKEGKPKDVMSNEERMNRLSEIVSSYSNNIFHIDFADDVQWAIEKITKLEAALGLIQQWDCLNPPNQNICDDHLWLKKLVDEALAT